MSRPEFLMVGKKVVPLSTVRWADFSRLASEGVVQVCLENPMHRDVSGTFDLHGAEAVEALLVIHPVALEAAGARWLKRSWTLHNLIGHPLLEILARLGFPKLGLRVHDATMPGAHRLRWPPKSA